MNSNTARRHRRRPLQKLWRSWNDEITLSGKIVIGAMLLSGLGSVSVQLPIYHLFCAITALVVLSLIAGLVCVPIVRVDGTMPNKVAAGQPLSVKYAVQNRGLFPAFDVGVDFLNLPRQIAHVGSVPTIAQLNRVETQSVQLQLVALARGYYELPRLRVFTTFPFNLFRIGTFRRAEPPLLVLPSFHPLEEIRVPLGTRYQPGGVALTSNIGESPEYIGNREYVNGDPLRHVEFRSWARLGKPVVREYQEEYYCRIALVIDTFVGARSRRRTIGHENLEAAISLTAAVAHSLSNGEYLIDLFAAGEELYVFRSGRHIAHFENILEILACLDASDASPFPEITHAVSEEAQRVSTAICVLLDWDEERRAFVQVLREAGCHVKLIVVRDQPLASLAGLDDVQDWTQLSANDIRSGKLDRL